MNVIENAVAGKRYISTGRRVPVFNPATGEVSAELPLSRLSELNDAVASAKKTEDRGAPRPFTPSNPDRPS